MMFVGVQAQLPGGWTVYSTIFWGSEAGSIYAGAQRGLFGL